ncbi:PaaI family thioesterase [Pararhizobium haloflavum]|uniref:PaaI family thioesterase n=1 Tax=Pararhizobium haloflavum TaxID=2037914 RepID=UPI0018E49666|nr:PaaI family thioesterase [Pararhizobium haloflavum]
MTTSMNDPRTAGWTMQADDGFVGLVGPFWTRMVGEHPAYGFLAEPRHANLLNVVQGGMLMTFADRALGLEAWKAAGDTPCVTLQFNTQFIAAAPIGAFVEVEPRVIRMTRSMVFLEGQILADGTLVASAQGIWKILRQRS